MKLNFKKLLLSALILIVLQVCEFFVIYQWMIQFDYQRIIQDDQQMS